MKSVLQLTITAVIVALITSNLLHTESKLDSEQATSVAANRVDGYGEVVQFVDAPHQPRDGSKICVDVTKGGDASELNPGIEKLAKYINIYNAAGNQPASVDIAVVLHGDATLTILNEQTYTERFKTKSNPNLDCLQKLHQAGVQFFVCGQSLTSKGGKPEQVLDFVSTAVSGVTAVVNLQTDGYAYVPLSK
ncbi:MAG: DsrE family protein [Planctomycetota bacterium]